MGVQFLAVAIGGAVGSALRYGTSLGATRVLGTSFPYGTLLVNLVGCLLAGIVFGLAEDRAGFLADGPYSAPHWVPRWLYDFLYVHAGDRDPHSGRGVGYRA